MWIYISISVRQILFDSQEERDWAHAIEASGFDCGLNAPDH